MCLIVMEFLSACVVLHYIHMTGLNVALARVMWAYNNWEVIVKECFIPFLKTVKMTLYIFYSMTRVTLMKNYIVF